jgi:hypothetical protein
MARTIPQIIDDIGMTALATKLGHRWPTKVQGWKERGKIPIQHVPAVVAAAADLGKPVTTEEIVSASAREQAA